VQFVTFCIDFCPLDNGLIRSKHAVVMILTFKILKVHDIVGGDGDNLFFFSDFIKDGNCLH
jgi:hypothetical protein